MINKLRTCTLLAIALSTTALGAGADGFFRKDTHDAAAGLGTSTQPGITKYFEFAAIQTNATTLAALGEAGEIQNDTTGAFGNFSLSGPVVCLKVTSPTHAVVGLIIKRGTGTAAAHIGEAFYLVAEDMRTLNLPDRFDNSGYTGTTTADCAGADGGTGGTVTRGNIVVDDD